jgi:hypothetical protein
MRGTKLTYLSWGALLIALCACALAGFMVWDISARLVDREANMLLADTQAAQNENAARISALAADTQQGRGELDALLQTDVVGMANTIDAAGHAAGATTQVVAASSGTLSAKTPANVNAVEFVVQANGTFGQVYHAAELFEALPIPSSVEELDFQHQQSTTGSWQLTARIRALTEATVSP